MRTRSIVWNLTVSLLVAIGMLESTYVLAQEAASSIVSQEKLRQAIQAALGPLEYSARASSERKQCFTCHHGALPAIALLDAGKQSFQVGPNAIAHQVQHAKAHLERGKETYRKKEGQGGKALTAGYALWLLAEANEPPSEITELVASYLLTEDATLGRWHHISGRPPMSDSDFSTTYFALVSLQKYGKLSEKEQIQQRMDRVRQWIDATTPHDTEDRVFRLMLLHALDYPSDILQSAANDLLNLQQNDGGWAQTQSMTSDVYATSTVLFALLRYGNLDAKETPKVQRGIHYLVHNQLQDGTWHVVTRAKGFQPYYESGFPHGKDQFLSIGASSWAVMALAEFLSTGKTESTNEANQVQSFRHSHPIPVQGDRDHGTAKIDELCFEFLQRHQLPGMAIALTKDNRLSVARGYGYADLESRTVVSPDSLFRIASISKPITAMAVLKLIEEKKLELDQPISQILTWDPLPNTSSQHVDPRWDQVTVRQLLQHRGGWDRHASFDPMFQARRFSKEQGFALPLRAEDFVAAMRHHKLDFDPGSKYAYSNFGYNLLGRVIEARSGMSYEAYVRDRLLHPLGLTRMQIGHTRKEERLPGEVSYYDPAQAKSIFPIDGNREAPVCYGGWSIESMDAHGGWLASATDLATLAVALDIPDHSKILSPEQIATMFEPPSSLPGDSKDARQDDPQKKSSRVFYSLGWNNRQLASGKINHWHVGSLPGTTTIVIKRHDGINMVALINSRFSRVEKGNQETVSADVDRLLHRLADSIETWPSGKQLLSQIP